MNFKSIGLKAALAATVLAGSAFAVAPAQAATFGKVSFGGLGELSSVKGSESSDVSQIVFKDGKLKINSGTGSFADYKNGTATFFSKSFATDLINQVSFVTFKKAGFANLTFNLTKFIQPKYVEIGSELDKGAVDSLGQFTSRVSGVFQPGASAVDEVISAFATIKQDNTKEGNYTNIVLSTTPIPTPALLPGLLGLGVAALRKRKSEESEVEATEKA